MGCPWCALSLSWAGGLCVLPVHPCLSSPLLHFLPQMQMLDKFPMEGGQKDPKQRIIPFLPGRTGGPSRIQARFGMAGAPSQPVGLGAHTGFSSLLLHQLSTTEFLGCNVSFGTPGFVSSVPSGC